MNFEGISLKKNFWRFVWPSVVAQWIFALYTMVDGMFVANGVSEIALTAVNLSFPFIASLFALSLMFAVGTSTIVAIFLGKKQVSQASEVFTQNIVLQVIISIILVAIAMPNLRELSLFLGAKEGVTLDYVVEYLTWIVPFSLAYLLSYSFEIILKTDGFPKKATLIVIIGALENCVLDWLFVMVFKKGVAGAAFATSISQISIIVLYVHHFLSGRGVLYFKKFRLSLRTIAREIRNGFSSGLTELSSGLVTFVFNQVILAFLNQEALVSYTIVSYVNSIVVLSATGIAQGSQPLISYYYGKGNMKNCRKLLKYCLVTAGVFCGLAFLLSYLAAGAIVSIYVGPELMELRQYSVNAFRTFIVSFLLVGFNIAISGYFTSVECAVSALVISAGRGCVLLIACLTAMAELFGGPGIWWSPTVSEGVCLLVTVGLFGRYVRGNREWRATGRT